MRVVYWSVYKCVYVWCDVCTLLHGLQHKACSEHMSSVANRIEFAVLYTHFSILLFLWNDFIFHYYQQKKRGKQQLWWQWKSWRGQYQLWIYQCVSVTRVYASKYAADNDVGEREIIGKKKGENYHFIPFKNIKCWCFFPVNIG